MLWRRHCSQERCQTPSKPVDVPLQNDGARKTFFLKKPELDLGEELVMAMKNKNIDKKPFCVFDGVQEPTDRKERRRRGRVRD